MKIKICSMKESRINSYRESDNEEVLMFKLGELQKNGKLDGFSIYPDKDELRDNEVYLNIDNPSQCDDVFEVLRLCKSSGVIADFHKNADASFIVTKFEESKKRAKKEEVTKGEDGSYLVTLDNGKQFTVVYYPNDLGDYHVDVMDSKTRMSWHNDFDNPEDAIKWGKEKIAEMGLEESKKRAKKEGVRIARYGEFDNGHVFHKWDHMSIEDAEMKARDASLNNPNDIYYVAFDDIMNPDSEYRWINGKKYRYDQVEIRDGKPHVKNESRRKSKRESKFEIGDYVVWDHNGKRYQVWDNDESNGTIMLIDPAEVPDNPTDTTDAAFEVDVNNVRYNESKSSKKESESTSGSLMMDAPEDVFEDKRSQWEDIIDSVSHTIHNYGRTLELYGYKNSLRDIEKKLKDLGFRTLKRDVEESVNKSKKESDYDFNQGTYQQGYDWGFEAYQGHKRKLSDADWESGTFSEDFYEGYHDGWSDAIEEENYNHPGYTESKKKSKKEFHIDSLPMTKDEFFKYVIQYFKDRNQGYVKKRLELTPYNKPGQYVLSTNNYTDFAYRDDFEKIVNELKNKYSINDPYTIFVDGSDTITVQLQESRKNSKKESIDNNSAVKLVKDRVKKEFPDFEVVGPTSDMYDGPRAGKIQFYIPVPEDSTEGYEVEKMLKEVESEYPDFEYEGYDWNNRYWFNISE